jgi:hypothetical protein
MSGRLAPSWIDDRAALSLALLARFLSGLNNRIAVLCILGLDNQLIVLLLL